MKKIAIITAAVLSSCVAQPAIASEVRDEIKSELCPKIERLAKAIMTNRQDGVPMSVLMSTPKTGNELADDLYPNMVKMAYEVNRYHTKEFKDRAISDFGEGFARMCYGA